MIRDNEHPRFGFLLRVLRVWSWKVTPLLKKQNFKNNKLNKKLVERGSRMSNHGVALVNKHIEVSKVKETELMVLHPKMQKTNSLKF